MFFVISSIKLRGFWCNLVHSFLNKFAAKSYINILHLTWIISLHYLVKLKMLITNAHHAHATIELLKEETPEIIPPWPWHPNSPDLNSYDYLIKLQRVQKSAREGVQILHHWSKSTNDAIGEWLLTWSSLACSVLSWCFHSCRCMQMHVMYKFICSISKIM